MTGYYEKSRDLTNSLILIIPLIILYQLGLLLFRFEGMNGVDFLTVFLLRSFGWEGLVIFNLLLAAFLIILASKRQKESQFDAGIAFGIFMESTIYAWFMGGLILFVMERSLPLAQGAGVANQIIIALGAGVNEEIVFRLGLITAIAYVLEEILEQPASVGVLVAVIVSSLLFSLAHHAGPGAEPLRLEPFVYRLLAGLLFAGLYWFRGLAIAVYTHATYDILVMVFR